MPAVSRTAVEIWKLRFRRLYGGGGVPPGPVPAPLLAWVPPSAGSSFTVTHNLATWAPIVLITLFAVNHTVFAGDPTNLAAAITGSRRLQESEFTASALNVNSVSVSLATPLVNDPTSASDYRLLAVDVFSPGSQPQSQQSGPQQLAALADVWAADAAETVSFTSASIEGGTASGVITGNRLELLQAAEELLADPLFLAGINAQPSRAWIPDFTLCRP